jgi:hypothetical protein
MDGMSQSAVLETAGEIVAIDSELDWVTALLAQGIEEALSRRAISATMTIQVEASSRPFSVAGLAPLTRKAWSRTDEVVVRDACGSGFDVHLGFAGGRPELTCRWRPRATRIGARYLLPSRFLLLAREVLIQYPLLWWASVRGRAPLHAIACTAGNGVALLAGPGGVGKSTLLQLELADGGRATSDNLCVADGRSVWGLVEPMRTAGAQGRRTTHGRVEAPLIGRVAQLVPDQIVIIRRGEAVAPLLISCDPEAAVRSLVTGTYVAGELGRFWSYAATLAAGTGIGPSHPLVVETARAFASRLNCFELILPARPGTRLAEVLNHSEAIA